MTSESSLGNPEELRSDGIDGNPPRRNYDTSAVALGRFVSELWFIFDQAQRYAAERNRANILVEREKRARQDADGCKDQIRKLNEMVRILKNGAGKMQTCENCRNLAESVVQFFQKLSPMLDGLKTEGDGFVVTSQGYTRSGYWHSLGMQQRVDAIDKIFDEVSRSIKDFKQNQLQNVC